MTTTLAERSRIRPATPGIQTRETVANILSLVRRHRGATQPAVAACVLAPRLVVLLASRRLGGRLALECPGDVAATVEPGHFDLIVGNLLSNATRYAGGATRLAVRAHGDLVTVTVGDDGPGVPDELRSGLFHGYRPGGRGRGLGLSVCRELARDNGGDLTYAVGPDGGADFTLVLPRVPLS